MHSCSCIFKLPAAQFLLAHLLYRKWVKKAQRQHGNRARTVQKVMNAINVCICYVFAPWFWLGAAMPAALFIERCLKMAARILWPQRTAVGALRRSSARAGSEGRVFEGRVTCHLPASSNVTSRCPPSHRPIVPRGEQQRSLRPLHATKQILAFCKGRLTV